jgi:hypothetical protein
MLCAWNPCIGYLTRQYNAHSSSYTASAVTTHPDDEHVIGQLEAVGFSGRIASCDLLVDRVYLAAHSLVVAALQ